MKIKSEYSEPKQGFFVPFLQVINNNFLTIGVCSVIIVGVLAISKSKEPRINYDCSKLSAENQLMLKDTIDGRLKLIQESMNTSLKSDNGFLRDDMQETVDQIMYDTRKEFCSPIKE